MKVQLSTNSGRYQLPSFGNRSNTVTRRLIEAHYEGLSPEGWRAFLNIPISARNTAADNLRRMVATRKPTITAESLKREAELAARLLRQNKRRHR